MNKLEYKDQHEKKLENALFLLSQNRIEDAYKTIGTKIHRVGAVSNHNSQHGDLWKALTTAYIGLIEYFLWCQHRGRDDTNGQENQDGEHWHRSVHCKPFSCSRGGGEGGGGMGRGGDLFIHPVLAKEIAV